MHPTSTLQTRQGGQGCRQGKIEGQSFGIVPLQTFTDTTLKDGHILVLSRRVGAICFPRKEKIFNIFGIVEPPGELGGMEVVQRRRRLGKPGCNGPNDPFMTPLPLMK